MSKIVVALFLILLLGQGSMSIAETIDVNLSDFRGRGGRVDWSPNGEFVVFDRKGRDGGFDLYITYDFTTEQCLTCNHPDLPNKKRNYGQPAVHPDGRYIVFQAEKQKHRFIIPLATNPGAGVFNDIWVYDLKTNRARPLLQVPNSKHHGVLHPQFSKDGKQLSWSEMYMGMKLKVPGQHAGSWKLKVATFSPDGLSDIKEYQPGEEVIYENHGFSLDGKSLFFSSNMRRSNPVNLSTDIYKMNLETGRLVRLTSEGYNEHAHISPDGKYIVWMSSIGNGDTYDYYKVGTDYWLMNVDGSNKRRLTYLNQPGHPHFRGRYAIAADFAWDPSSSAKNGYRIYAYLHELVFKNFRIKATDRAAKGEYNFMLEFSLDAGDEQGVPNGPPTSNSLQESKKQL